MSVFIQKMGSKHPSWDNFFNDEVVQNLKDIKEQIGDNFTPRIENVLRFATVDLKKVKVIWIGIDPYPDPNKATGRSFEVGDAKIWEDVNPSLKNILKLLHKTHGDLEKAESIEEIYRQIEGEKFLICPPNCIFDYWEGQGVLFLNTILTIDCYGKSACKKHSDAWRPFFNKLIKYIIDENQDIHYFIWGKDVKKRLNKIDVFDSKINKNRKHFSFHPAINHSEENGDSFLNNRCFRETWQKIDWV